MTETSRQKAVPTVQVDNDRVKATQWFFQPGAETGWHRHGMAYVVVPMTDCHMLLEEPGGTSRQVTVERGASYAREAGVEHNVINAGAAPMTFVEIELKV